RIDVGHDALAPLAVDRNGLQPDPDAVAALEQDVGRALADHHPLVGVLVVDLDARHHLAIRGERDLPHAVEASLATLGHAELALGHDERRFGRVALYLPHAARRLAQIGIARETAAAQHDDVLGE